MSVEKNQNRLAMLSNEGKSSTKMEILPLTGLRFFAALFVCSAHVIPYVMPGLNPIYAQLSAEGMTLFFVLSGFVIHYNYSLSIRKNPMMGIYNFGVSRFARLYPLFFACICLDIIKNFGYSTLPITFTEAIPYYLTLTQSWFYLILDKNSLIYQFGLMPSVSWSISTEWFFYLVYPCICFGIIKANKIDNKIAVLLFICMIMPILIAMAYFNQSSINLFAIKHFGVHAGSANTQDSFFRWLIYFSPYSRISEFLLGCLTASIFMQMATRKPSQIEERIGFIILICALISMVILHYFIFKQQSLYLLSWLITLHQCFGFAPSCAIIIFCCARYSNVINHFLSRPVILLGGEISYSMYILHLPIAEAFSRDAAPITSWDVGLADFSRLIIAFAAIFGAALVSYRTIEVPARTILRKWLIIRDKKYPIYIERAEQLQSDGILRGND